MRKVLILIAFTAMINAWAQDDPTPINYSIDMFPKTPEGASSSKFVDIPPSDYTGVAAFSIPIYTVEVDGLKLPIELDYSTTGIKVSEIAGRVGLGWSLNIGGISLSKQVIGTPDMENGYRPIIMDANFEPDGTGIDPNDPNDPLLIAFKVLGIESNESELPMDIKPDIYSYGLPTGSGKYILDSSGDFGIPVPYNRIKINGNGGAQKITDEQGNYYMFERGFGIKSYNSCNNAISPLLHYPDPNYRIANVKTVKNNEVTFIYSKQVDAHFVTSMVEQIRLHNTKTGDGMGLPGPVPPKCYNHTYSDEKILTQVNFPGGTVSFLYNDDTNPGSTREDLPGDYYLKKVIVKNLDGETIRDVALHYDSYFVSPNAGSYSGEMFQGIDKRLKLTSVTDELTGGQYKLTYYEDNVLPHRLSNSQDFWGVYNGKPNEETSIPTTVYKRRNITTEPFILFLGADKQPDSIYAVTGNLKKLTYPTGGYTEITYEPDDYFQSTYRPPTVYNYIPQFAYASSTQSSPEEFSITYQPYNFEIEFTGDNDDGSGEANIENCKIKIYKGTNPVPVFQSAQYGTFSEYDSYQPGDYSINITPGLDQDTFEPVDCVASLNWYEQQLINDSSYRQTGTLRVKKIRSVDTVTGEIVREFTYLDPTTNYTQTSGKNLGDEYFVALYTKEYPHDRTGTYMTDLMLSNNPGWQISTVRGKPIGYDYVQEIYKSPTESFKKEYWFTNDTDDAWSNHDPYGVINYTWPVEGTTRGLKRYEKIFDDDNHLVQKTDYEYDYDAYFNSEATSHPPGTPLIAHGLEINLKRIACSGLNCYYEFTEETFPIKNYWIKNVKTTTTEYDNNQPKVVTEVTNEYSPDYKHTFLSKSITENSLGETLATEYEYPQDLTSGYEQSSLMQEMETRNMIATPVKTVTKSNGTVTSEQRTLYDYYSGANGQQLILPEYVYAKKGAGTTSADKKITYDKYDEQGNLLQYTMADGTPVSIIWGYNKQYPIAKVEGVTYTTIASQAGTLATLSDSGNLTQTSFETLRNTTGALVTCYIHEPLVGVTSITSPNGQTEYYEYDNAGRLEEVYIMEGGTKKILKTVDYNYQP